MLHNQDRSARQNIDWDTDTGLRNDNMWRISTIYAYGVNNTMNTMS